MSVPDDSSLTPRQFQSVRAAAAKALASAGAHGTFPTPVDDVVAAAKLVVADESLQDVGLLAVVAQ